MFRVLTPIVRSSYNCNYSFWHWSTRLAHGTNSLLLISLGVSAQNDATVFSLLYFCRQLYMFRALTPIIWISYNCNYSFWHWLTRLAHGANSLLLISLGLSWKGHPSSYLKHRAIRVENVPIIDWGLGTAVAQWLRHCATNRKVAGSISAGVREFFIDIKSFRSPWGRLSL